MRYIQCSKSKHQSLSFHRGTDLPIEDYRLTHWWYAFSGLDRFKNFKRSRPPCSSPVSSRVPWPRTPNQFTVVTFLKHHSVVPYPVPIFPLVPIFHSFTYSYNLSNLIELPLIYSRAQLVELERMYECVRIAPNRPKIQVYKNIINHKFIFNYHYNSAHCSDRFKSVTIKDPRTAGVRWQVGPNGSDSDRRRLS